MAASSSRADGLLPAIAVERTVRSLLLIVAGLVALVELRADSPPGGAPSATRRVPWGWTRRATLSPTSSTAPGR